MRIGRTRRSGSRPCRRRAAERGAPPWSSTGRAAWRAPHHLAAEDQGRELRCIRMATTSLSAPSSTILPSVSFVRSNFALGLRFALVAKVAAGRPLADRLDDRRFAANRTQEAMLVQAQHSRRRRLSSTTYFDQSLPTRL